jgi:hypothetical protein
VLLDPEVAGALTLQGAVEREVGLKIGSRRGGSPSFPRRRGRRLGIGDRDDVQGCTRQPGELDGAGERQLGGSRAIGADDDGAVDRSSSARVRRTVTRGAVTGKVPRRRGLGPDRSDGVVREGPGSARTGAMA